MKYKNLAKYLTLIILAAIMLISFPAKLNADVGYGDTERSASDLASGDPEYGYVGGAFAVAGNAVKDTMESLFGDLSGSGEDIVSFVGFEGGLSAPSGAELDESLRRARSAREFIVNAVNFALSFLGVIAMTVIIYGGFLFITAGGNEEQSGKGKKAIQYSIIGILIIIASFAIVNTVLRVGGGEERDEGGLRGVGSESSNISQQSIYNLAAASVTSALNDFLRAYKNLIAIDATIKQIKALPAPGSANENRSYINQVAAALTEIKNNTNILDRINIEARTLLDGWVANMSSQNLAADEYESGEIQDDFEPHLDALSEASKEDFENVINKMVGEDNRGGRLGLAKQILGEITDAATKAIISRGFVTERDLKRAFAGIDPNITIHEVFTNAVDAVAEARNLPDNIRNNQLAVNVVKTLDQLNIIIKNTEFVYVRIRASVREGNAPLIVELNGLDSRDPTGDTITDERYEWDPIGASANEMDVMSLIFSGEVSNVMQGAINAVECTSNRGATVVCTYHQPGTYIVRLKIKSKDPARVATGNAFLPITVLPSVARISLKATVGSITEDLHKYERDARGRWRIVIDKREFQITSEEAMRTPGVIFDASGSQAGGGATIRSFQWNFGDGTGFEETETVQHVYREKGKFPLQLEVTDTGSRKDRKLVNIAIGSIAARMYASASESEPDELIEFDGSLSRSDRGSISSYEWRILEIKSDGSEEDVTNLRNKIEILGGDTGAILRAKFKTPGRYKVELTVSDGSETAAPYSEIILIKSRRPRANFTVLACPDSCVDSARPSIVELDAGSTFDPDDDPLLFEWKIFSEQGSELERGSSFIVVDSNALYGPDAKKIRLKFTKTGKYRIQLTVKDDLPADLQQTDIKEKEIEISSIVEANWNERLEPVQQMQEGEAKFTLKGNVLHADRVQIDFGDGETNEQSIQLTNDRGEFEFEHIYTEVGSFLVRLRAISDEGNGETEITKRLYVSAGDNPLAVIEVSTDNNEIVLPDPTPENPNPALEIIRNKIIKFSGKRSLDSRGNRDINLRYSWDFGDNKRSTGRDTEHTYEDTSPEGEVFTVTLSVSEVQDPSKTAQTTFLVKVISKKPEVNTLSLEKVTVGNVTPVDVKLTAEGASDPDGRITNYQFWYYDPAHRERKLGTIDTQLDNAVVTVETAGEQGEEHEYYFCVSVTDNENTTSECSELFAQEELPRLKVENGQNRAPLADFSADRTNARINETITFTSSSTDEDGRITQYVWDTEGDGFQNNNPTELSTVTHRYDRQSPQSGFRVKLKAIDDKGAAGYSREIPIFIGSGAEKPTANFSYQVQLSPPRRVKFFDASVSDAAHGARIVRWIWDFDTSQEFGCNTNPRPEYCNGNKTDDIDSEDQNPIFDFPASGSYQVKLTVEDSEGNMSDPKTSLVNVIAGAAGGAAAPGASSLRAELRTQPQFVFEPILLCTPATSEECKRKVIHIPASSNGEPITLFWGDSAGDITSYQIEKNIWCDSDGNGEQADDIDHVHPDSSNPASGTCVIAGTNNTSEACWTTTYQRHARTHFDKLGRFMTVLTALDRNGNTDADSVEIVFDGEVDEEQVRNTRCDGTPQSSRLAASFFQDIGVQNTILLGLASGIVVILMVFAVANFLPRGKRRI